MISTQSIWRVSDGADEAEDEEDEDEDDDDDVELVEVDLDRERRRAAGFVGSGLTARAGGPFFLPGSAAAFFSAGRESLAGVADRSGGRRVVAAGERDALPAGAGLAARVGVGRRVSRRSSRRGEGRRPSRRGEGRRSALRSCRSSLRSCRLVGALGDDALSAFGGGGRKDGPGTV